MYNPPHFRQVDVAALKGLIRASRLGTVITVADGIPVASHVPLLLVDDPPPFGTLWCHVARANPQWKTATGTALVTFVDTDAYVSPSWYQSKREHGKVVPTWNYTAVHAYGEIRFVEDPERLRTLVAALTDVHEGRRTDPWRITDAPPPFIDSQLRGIVGLEITVRTLEGKWKLSQNRSDADVAGVISGLTASSDARDHAASAAMQAARRERDAR